MKRLLIIALILCLFVGSACAASPVYSWFSGVSDGKPFITVITNTPQPVAPTGYCKVSKFIGSKTVIAKVPTYTTWQ